MIPKVSIITVTLNSGPALESTILSIISQTYRNYEFIIIDGGSRDETLELIEKYRASVSVLVSEPDKGLYDAMNKGIGLATGEYLNFLNAGDVYLSPDTLGTVFSYGQPPGDFVYGDMIIVESDRSHSRLQRAMPFTKKRLIKFGTGVVCHQAVFVKREIAPEYNIKYRYKAELNWYFDLLNDSRDLTITYLPQPLIKYLLGGVGQRNFWANQWEWMKVVKDRFGIPALILFALPLRILLKLPYRYKWLRSLIHGIHPYKY